MIRQPSSVIIAGPSGSGKSELVEQWLRYLNVFQVKPHKIVYAYDRCQPRFDRMQKKDEIQFHRGLPDPRHLTQWFGRTRGGVLVLDDLMEEGGQDKRVLDLFTKDSHHRNITVLYLTQDLFPPGKFSKTINHLHGDDPHWTPHHCRQTTATTSPRALPTVPRFVPSVR